jgi:predicted amidohydrolase
MVRVAVVQTDPQLGQKRRNLEEVERAAARAGKAGAQLIVLPECHLTGYVYESLEEALAVAEPVPGPASERVSELAAQHSLYIVVGTLERVGDRCYNSTLLAGPQGIEAVYRKTHTLCLGVDRFTTPGNLGLHVHDLPLGRIGILICYDLRFPEAARVLALAGVQAIALPTNWPITSHIQADVFTRSRAAENRIFLLAADRVGRERGTTFLGRSQIVSPDGTVVAEASATHPDFLMADIDLSEADSKRVVVRPGEHEFDFFGDRRPDLYGSLVALQELAEVR